MLGWPKVPLGAPITNELFGQLNNLPRVTQLIIRAGLETQAAWPQVLSSSLCLPALEPLDCLEGRLET